jgi:hypothetical protein
MRFRLLKLLPLFLNCHSEQREECPHRSNLTCSLIDISNHESIFPCFCLPLVFPRGPEAQAAIDSPNPSSNSSMIHAFNALAVVSKLSFRAARGIPALFKSHVQPHRHFNHESIFLCSCLPLVFPCGQRLKQQSILRTHPAIRQSALHNLCLRIFRNLQGVRN